MPAAFQTKIPVQVLPGDFLFGINADFFPLSINKYFLRFYIHWYLSTNL
jgi:hypothetical protein